jgi:hypothetical protein
MSALTRSIIINWLTIVSPHFTWVQSKEPIAPFFQDKVSVPQYAILIKDSTCAQNWNYWKPLFCYFSHHWVKCHVQKVRQKISLESYVFYKIEWQTELSKQSIAITISSFPQSRQNNRLPATKKVLEDNTSCYRENLTRIYLFQDLP